MAHRVPITVRLDSFEGPLDLLLYLIQSHELDISKISLGKITGQYLAYVQLMQELNFDIASEFLVMAATLLQWKSKALLPSEKVDALGNAIQDEEMTQDELLRQLLEHQRFMQAGSDLAVLPKLGEDVFTRPVQKVATEKVWREMQVTDLALCYQDMLMRARKRTQILKKETVSITDKIMEFSDRLQIGKIVDMRTLLLELNSRPEIVATFLASLELSRLRKMKLYQEEVYQEIYVELLESIKGFDSKLASGFDAVTAKIEEAISEHVSQADQAHAAAGVADSAALASSGNAAAPSSSDATPNKNRGRSGTLVHVSASGNTGSDAGRDFDLAAFGEPARSLDDPGSPGSPGDNERNVAGSDDKIATAATPDSTGAQV